MVLCLANTGRITTRIFMALPSRILRRIPPPAAGDNGGAAQSQQGCQPYGQQPAWPGNQQAGGWPYAQGRQSVRSGRISGRVPGHAGPAVWSTAERSASPAALLPRHRPERSKPEPTLRALGFVCDHLLYPRPVLPGASALGTDGRGGNVGARALSI